MKSNNNKIVWMFVLILSVATSCTDFLDSRAYDFVSPDNFYKNENDAKLALAGVYASIAHEHTYGSVYSLKMSNIDDLSYFYRRASYGTTQVYGNGHNTGNNEVYNAWSMFYKGIESANVFLERIEKANIDEDIKTRMLGEVRFLRAYYHFLLIQGWKDVPLRKVAFKDVSKSAMAATPHGQALDWVIEEMEACIDMVDDKEYDKTPSYVKKNTVLGILARVCLFRAGYPSNGGKPYYEKAAKYADAVKKSGKHRLNPDVYVLWKNIASDRYDPEYNESIWEAEFVGSRLDGIFTWSKIGNEIGNRQQNAAPDGMGYTYNFYAGTLILWDLFEKNPGDKRRDLSMAPYTLDKQDKRQYWRLNNKKGDVESKGDDEIVQRLCGKFRREWETSVPRHKNYTQENYPLLRYSDVLLMLAEAENEANQGPTALAYEAINIVRERAGIPTLNAGMSYADFQQEVRDERARELCFESLRRYDLIRWGIYLDAIANLGKATEDQRWPKSVTYGSAYALYERTQKKHEFFPIPSRELAVNTELEQNPLW